MQTIIPLVPRLLHTVDSPPAVGTKITFVPLLVIPNVALFDDINFLNCRSFPISELNTPIPDVPILLAVVKSVPDVSNIVILDSWLINTSSIQTRISFSCHI